LTTEQSKSEEKIIEEQTKLKIENDNVILLEDPSYVNNNDKKVELEKIKIIPTSNEKSTELTEEVKLVNSTNTV